MAAAEPRPDGVHPAAAVGFDREAEAYDRVRPSYPEGVLQILADEGVADDGVVCDLAAGTGIFTSLLIESGYRVVAVEPTAGMRDRLVRAGPEIEVLDGTAESLPLPDESVDAVTVAQAFHWFDAAPALAEIRRVLRTDGMLLLVWNVRDETVDWVRALTELAAERSGGRPYDDHRDREWEDTVAAASGFTPLLSTRFDNPVDTTPQGVVDRVRSTSFVAALDDEPRMALLTEVAQLVASHPETSGKTSFVYPHETVAYWCHRSG